MFQGRKRRMVTLGRLMIFDGLEYAFYESFHNSPSWGGSIHSPEVRATGDPNWRLLRAFAGDPGDAEMEATGTLAGINILQPMTIIGSTDPSIGDLKTQTDTGTERIRITIFARHGISHIPVAHVDETVHP